jgi:hypothetical protein
MAIPFYKMLIRGGKLRNSCRLIFSVSDIASKKDIIRDYGIEFYRKYRATSKAKFKELLPQIEDIGDSIFKLNYLFIPVYFSWYDALKKQLPAEEASRMIWQIHESCMKRFPRPLLRMFAKQSYLGTFQRKASKAESMGKAGTLHPLDWRVEYKPGDRHTFGINIYECAFLKQAKRLGYMELFPTICRMDYLFSHYMDTGFVRTKTLGDGNDCCNCTYTFPGTCEWAPEKGFTDRK